MNEGDFSIECLDEDEAFVMESLLAEKHEERIEKSKNTTQNPATKKSSDIWDDYHIYMLLHLYKKWKNGNPKRVWEEVANGLNAGGMRVTAAQSKSKFHNLLSKYKETRDHNNKSGSNRITCPFYDAFEDICRKEHNVTPVHSCSSINPTKGSMKTEKKRKADVDMEIGGEKDGERAKRQPRPPLKIENEERENLEESGRRVRTKKSTNDELLTYMQKSTDSLVRVFENSANGFTAALTNLVNIIAEKKSGDSSK